VLGSKKKLVLFITASLVFGAMVNMGVALWLIATPQKRYGFAYIDTDGYANPDAPIFYPPDRWPEVFGEGWEPYEKIVSELAVSVGHRIAILKAMEEWTVPIERDGVQRWRQRTARVIMREAGWPFRSFRCKAGWITTQEFDYVAIEERVAKPGEYLSEPWEPMVVEDRKSVV